MIRRGHKGKFGPKQRLVTYEMKLPYFNITSTWKPRHRMQPGDSGKPILTDLSLRDLGDLLEKKDGKPPMVVRFSGKLGMCPMLSIARLT